MPSFIVRTDSTQGATANDGIWYNGGMWSSGTTTTASPMIQTRYYTSTSATSYVSTFTTTTSLGTGTFTGEQGIFYYYAGNTYDGAQRPVDLVKESKILLRRKQHATRGAIKRAFALMSNLGMENEARIFIGGDGAFEVAHPDSMLKFRFSRDDYSLIQHTERPGYSTPYKLELLTKEGQFLSKLCVFVKDTPVLDQVLALSMFIKSGAEDYVLEKANFFGRVKNKPLLEDMAVAFPALEHKFLNTVNR